MRVATRAAVAVALLIGVYLLAFAVIGAAVTLLLLLLSHPSAALLKVFVLTALAAAGVVRGLFSALRRRDGGEQPGWPVAAAEQPRLWQMVGDIAQRMGTRAPDEIRLVPVVNAAVLEESSWLGLRGGTRRMYVGVPLVHALTVDELRAVLAHELGHYSGRHTTLGPVVRRGHDALEHILVGLRRRRYVSAIFRAYAKLFFRVSRSVSRRQEFEADASAAAIAGRGAAVAALSKLPATTAAWGFFLERYVSPPIEAEVIPQPLLGGFARLLDEPSRQAELATIGLGEGAAGPYDTHPPLPDRIAALRATQADEPDTSGPALALFDDGAGMERRFLEALLRQPDLPSSDWDAAVDKAARARGDAAADALYDVVRRIGDREPSLAAVIDALRAGEANRLAAALHPQGGTAAAQLDALAYAVTWAVAVALVDRGELRWSVSWSDAPWRAIGKIDPDEVRELVDAAVRDPDAVPELESRLRAVLPDLSALWRGQAVPASDSGVS
jgi:Zn-dependent protease with chaperone function